MEQYRNNEIPPIEYTPGTGEFRNAVIDLAHYWTAIAEDLHTDEPGKQERTAAACLRFRKECAMFDYARALQWHDPQDVSVHADIPYLPDGGYRDGEVRGHLLDAYIPRDAIVRGGNTLPVYIDIHGGGFTYGYKELNRNFNTHLADLGFGVFSLNYRPAPQTDLVGQLHDIQAALRWIDEHITLFPVSPDNIFITGDSAGACLSLLTLLIEHSDDAARAFGIGRASGIHLRGASLISGVYDITPSSPMRARLIETVGNEFFAGLDDAAVFLDPADWLTQGIGIPPLFLVTSSDDFVQSETLALATSLARNGRDFELHDFKVPPTQTLGHVFPVGMTWLPESERVLHGIRAFSYPLAQ
ncbi:alpha/beta hydrolase [Bifidobacterium animalis]|uniref:alpha/beta hydrolase n=1 Tax=Bifidobacterium animalis TaxID=28025 RepID=UPI001C3EB1A9|nr:alpha/beta hydrolase [Bifidobacterium animalis]MCR1995432.1 alpha/beta hydrolase [Bifidobacterium animalis subsp. animalis]